MANDPFAALASSPDKTPEIEKVNTIIYIFGVLILIVIIAATCVVGAIVLTQ